MVNCIPSYGVFMSQKEKMSVKAGGNVKYVFVVNPMAGRGDNSLRLVEQIKEECSAKNVDFEIYMTEGVGDGERIVSKRISEEADTEIAFIACGGDGTLCEVANGIMHSNSADRTYLGVVPMGTGNDFVRNFSFSENFLNIGDQLLASSINIDLIKYNDSYAVNMINIGFDCEVVFKKEEIQAKKIFPSKLSYIIGLVATLIKKPGVECGITLDGEDFSMQKYLLTTYANGEFCGGGFHSNPESTLNNGKINVLRVNDVTRRKFVSIVGSYKKGTHLVHTDILSSSLADEVHIKFKKPTNISVDGEIVKVNELFMNTAVSAIRFLVPKGSEYLKRSEKLEGSAV